jgi:phosphatidylglycerol:prolipoprotein diacylglycerol transferase
MELFPDGKTFITIGPLSIQWYAVCILLGAGVAYWIGQYQFKKHGYSRELLSDYFFGVLIVGVIGARIWYVIFMFNELYRDNLMDIFMFRNGGLAIQGGIITGLIFSWWFFKKHKIDFFFAGDAILPAVLVAQAFGRWGNFFNQEAYGNAVSLDFLQGLHLPQFIIDHMYINGSYYHPTFLYESVCNIVGFLLIYFIIRRFQKKQGILFFSYFIWYGITRFFIEGLRTDSLYFLGFRTAQLTSIVFVIVGIIGIVWCIKKGKAVVTDKQEPL